MTEIILQKNLLPDSSVRFDLIGRDLPKNFLGLAVDISFQSNFSDSDYKGAVLSPSLKTLSDQNSLIEMVKAEPEQGKIVLGLTQKAGLLKPLEDGVLLSFVFGNNSLQASGFSNQVLSVMENRRRDVQARWEIQEALAPNEASKTAETSQPAGKESFSPDNEEQLGDKDPEILSKQTTLTSSDPKEVGGFVDWNMRWPELSILMALALITALFFYWRTVSDKNAVAQRV